MIGQISTTQLANNFDGLVLTDRQCEGDCVLADCGRTSTTSSTAQTASVQTTCAHRRVTSLPSQSMPGAPMTAAEVIRRYGDELSGFEQREVLNYRYIWYVGHPASRLKRRRSIAGLCNPRSTTKGACVLPQCALPNDGYDNADGSYRFILHDHIAYRFEVLNVMGRGAFGQVAEVFDHCTRCRLAMKTVLRQSRAKYREILELKALKRLAQSSRKGANTCIIEYLGSFMFRNHICLLFEPGYKNLYEHLKGNQFKPIPLPTIRAYAYQLVRALVHLKRAKIIHCDLKPENILLMSPRNNSIRVIDFGSSQIGSSTRPPSTYVQSRYYRSPEIILGLPYGYPIDMWSFGCIIAELLSGSPLFAGVDETDQIGLMIEVLGQIPSEIQEQSPRKAIIRSVNRNLEIHNQPYWIEKADRLSEVLQIKNDDLDDIRLLDMVRQALMWTPSKRLLPEDALAHPFICGTLRQS